MTAPVNVNVEKARAAWGADLTEWVLQLAQEADRTSQTAVARRINYSNSAVSQVLARKYDKGDLGKVEAAVRGAFMGETVMCPVLDEIGRDWCLVQQGMPRTGASAIRERLYRACRDRCPHSRIKGVDDDAA